MLNLTANGSYSAALYIILPAVIYWLFSILHPLTAQSQSPLSKAPEMALPAARISAKKSPTAAIIFMHGLGDRGTGWQFLADEAARRNVLEHVNFVFPDAPLRPITLVGFLIWKLSCCFHVTNLLEFWYANACLV